MIFLNRGPAHPGFFGQLRPAEREKLGLHQDRRRFRPSVSGLEGRQLLSGATLSTVATFRDSNETIVGGLVEDSQGNLYGTTSAAGQVQGKDIGRVFEVASGTGKITTLATFSNSNGYGISGLSIDGKGNLYGTISEEGGTNGDGRVFEIEAGTDTVTTLARFDGTNGEFPNGVTVDSQGNLFGTTAIAGSDPSPTAFETGGATAFEVGKGTGVVTPIASFDENGAAPKDVVVDGQGNLFGVNAAGGKTGVGTVYEIAKGSNTVTTLATFPGDSGAGISGLTMDSQGNLYGTTEDGGTYNDGSVFEIAKGSNTVTTLASFNGTYNPHGTTNGVNGSIPNPGSGVVMDAQGNLYGTTELGGANNDGTVYEIAKGSNTVTTLLSFSGFNGTTVNDLTLEGQNNLLISTNGSGTGDGSLYRVKLNPQLTTASTTQAATVLPKPSAIRSVTTRAR